MSEYVEWGALLNVVLIGLLFGAGLPALFALGVRAMASQGARRDDGTLPLTRAVAGWLCFGIIIVAVLGAVGYIAAGGH